MDLISDRIRKNMAVGFRLGSGAARIQAWPASLNIGGVPSWPGQGDSPVHGLSTGILLGAICPKQGGWEGVLYVHLDFVRSGHLSAK